MHTGQMADTLEVAKTFIESLGGVGLHDKFVPGPDTVEVTESHGHPMIRLDYHLSLLTDPDRAVVVEALAGLEQFHWGTATNPFGVAQISTDDAVVHVEIQIYTPGPESRGPLLQAALVSAGWRNVAGVG
jgi:hypothetical protein